MKIKYIAMLILFLPLLTLSQSKERKTRYKKQLKINSKDQINQLHNGALLVRLKTKRKTILALQERGNNKLATKIENEQAILNKQIIQAFRENFDFCPVYFFYSEDSQNVLDKQFDKIKFLDDSLNIDENINFNIKLFLTAEFANIEQDTATYTGQNYQIHTKDGLENRTSYHGGTNMGFGALIIKSDQLIQLNRPFPYYVRTLESLPIRRKPKKTVSKMNDQLHQFLIESLKYNR